MAKRGRKPKMLVTAFETAKEGVYDVDINGRYQGIWREDRLDAFLRFNQQYEIQYVKIKPDEQ